VSVQPWELLFAASAALAVGVVAGLFGVGGNFLIVPLLSLIGIPMPEAVGSAACQALGPATTGLLFRRIHRDDCRLPVMLTGGLFLGVVVGAHTLHLIAHTQEETPPPTSSPSTADLVVLGTYFVILLGLGSLSLWDTHRPPHLARPHLQLDRWPLPPRVHVPEFAPGRTSLTALCWFGLAVGFISGLLGISGGLLVVPGLIYLFAMKTRRAITLSMIIVWIVALQSTLAHAWHHHVRLEYVVCLLLGGTIGARIGSQLNARMPGRNLRRGFGWLLVCSALFVLVRILLLYL
jgi:uncharacterized membrane protein YfcA